MADRVIAIVLAGAFLSGASAGEIPNAVSSAKPGSGVIRELLGSSPGPGDALMLRAVADLFEREQAAPAVEQPRRLAVHLRNAPAADVLKTLQDGLVAYANRAIVVAEPVSNTLLISASPRTANSVAARIAKLDLRPDMITASVCIANFITPASDSQQRESTGSLISEEPPVMEKDGAAWLAWAKKHRRLEILRSPQIMTLVNQPAMIQIGSAAPQAAGGPDTARANQPQVGFKVGLTPRLSPEKQIVMELDMELASIVKRGEAGDPVISKTIVQTTVAAEDGETVVVGGMQQPSGEGQRQLIIAVTPRLTPAQ